MFVYFEMMLDLFVNQGLSLRIRSRLPQSLQQEDVAAIIQPS